MYGVNLNEVDNNFSPLKKKFANATCKKSSFLVDRAKRIVARENPTFEPRLQGNI